MRLTPTWRLSSTALTRRLPSSTGCTPERKARANTPSTAPSRRRSKSRRNPISGLSPPAQAAPGSQVFEAGHPFHLARRRAGNCSGGGTGTLLLRFRTNSDVQPAATYPALPQCTRLGLAIRSHGADRGAPVAQLPQSMSHAEDTRVARGRHPLLQSGAVARASGGIGRRAGFRFLCPQGRGGSTPPSRTAVADPTRRPAVGSRLAAMSAQGAEPPDPRWRHGGPFGQASVSLATRPGFRGLFCPLFLPFEWPK